jgi:hypothetical protein
MENKNDFLLLSFSSLPHQKHCYERLKKDFSEISQNQLATQEDFDRLDIKLNKCNLIISECLEALLEQDQKTQNAVIKRLQRLELAFEVERKNYSRLALSLGQSTPVFKAESLALQQPKIEPRRF